jgi:hypothetical protein
MLRVIRSPKVVDLRHVLRELLIGPGPLADDRPLGAPLLKQRHQEGPARLSGFGLQLALVNLQPTQNHGGLGGG